MDKTKTEDATVKKYTKLELDTLSVKYAQSIAKKSSMIDSWLSKSSTKQKDDDKDDAKTQEKSFNSLEDGGKADKDMSAKKPDEKESDKTTTTNTTTAAQNEPNKPLANNDNVDPLSLFKTLPSSSVGLGSKKSQESAFNRNSIFKNGLTFPPNSGGLVQDDKALQILKSQLNKQRREEFRQKAIATRLENEKNNNGKKVEEDDEDSEEDSRGAMISKSSRKGVSTEDDEGKSNGTSLFSKKKQKRGSYFDEYKKNKKKRRG